LYLSLETNFEIPFEIYVKQVSPMIRLYDLVIIYKFTSFNIINYFSWSRYKIYAL